MADTDNLDTAISLILTELSTTADQPNYSIDGQSVQRGELVTRLKELRALKAAISGPFEVETIGET